MKALKDNGISVISMQDLLTWRKGEKAIPSKSAVITIDDEWNSQYYVAWPILKEFSYPFTLFVYTLWVNTGGKSMTWNQLEEMRDAGVDIEAHTVSHRDLRHAPRGQDYTAWLHNEVYGCKETLENKLGVKIIALAFPYGFHNEVVRETAKEAGYEMQFTVYGRHMDINVPTDQIGRYAIDSLKGDIFKAALDFGTSDSTQPGVETSQLASAAMLTEPLNDQHITDPKPTIKANLASMGDVDPKSVEMRISGFGLVPALYDPKTKLVTYAFTQKLVPKMYIVILTAKVNGKKAETRWDFTVDPAGPVANNHSDNRFNFTTVFAVVFDRAFQPVIANRFSTADEMRKALKELADVQPEGSISSAEEIVTEIRRASKSDVAESRREDGEVIRRPIRRSAQSATQLPIFLVQTTGGPRRIGTR